MDPDDVTTCEGSLPRGGGHERLVHLQRDPGEGRVRQPGVPEEDGLRGPEVSERAVRQSGPAGMLTQVVNR